jgi:lipoate-protein ligase B
LKYEIIEGICKINGIQVQRQFGKNKIAALNLRITKGITIEDFNENLKLYETALKKLNTTHKISLSAKVKFKKKVNYLRIIYNLTLIKY